MNVVDRMLELEPGFAKAILLKAKMMSENPDKYSLPLFSLSLHL